MTIGATVEPKPVFPHYSPTRRALWNAASNLTVKAQSEDEEADRYERWTTEHRAKAKDLREQAAAMKVAARALGGMDKSGIVVEPSTEAEPPPPSPKLCR